MVLAYYRRFMALVAVALVGGAAYYFITNYGTTAGFDWAVEKTLAGNQSDTLRTKLVTTAIEIGIDYPLLGVSPERLPYELKSPSTARRRGPHNVIGHLAGGSGLICLERCCMRVGRCGESSRPCR